MNRQRQGKTIAVVTFKDGSTIMLHQEDALTFQNAMNVGKAMVTLSVGTHTCMASSIAHYEGYHGYLNRTHQVDTTQLYDASTLLLEEKRPILSEEDMQNALYRGMQNNPPYLASKQASQDYIPRYSRENKSGWKNGKWTFAQHCSDRDAIHVFTAIPTPLIDKKRQEEAEEKERRKTYAQSRYSKQSAIMHS